MAPRLSFSIITKEAIRVLALVRRKSKDWSEFFDRRVDPDVLRFFRRQFTSEGREGGTPWPPLRPSTIQIKRESGRAQMGTMRFSNELWGSLTKRTGPKVLKVVTPKLYVRGTTVQSEGVPYPALHQEGYTIDKVFGKLMKHRRVVPPRPLVPDEMPMKYVKRWEGLAAKYLETGDLSGRGFSGFK